MAKGWHRESRRHALASKGIKTAVQGKPVITLKTYKNAKKKAEELKKLLENEDYKAIR